MDPKYYNERQFEAELNSLPKIRTMHPDALVVMSHRQWALAAGVPVGSIPAMLSRGILIRDPRTGAVSAGDAVRFCDESIAIVSQRIVRAIGLSEREFSSNATAQEKARQLVTKTLRAIQVGETPPV